MEIINLNDINHSEIIKNVKFRPKIEVYFAIVAGIICIFIPHWAMKVFGIVSICLGATVLIVVKDKLTLSLAKDYLIIYKENETIKLNYDEISEWTIKVNPGATGIGFMLNDGDFLFVPTFEHEKARQALNKVIHDKESSEKKLKENYIERDTIIKKIKRKFGK